MRAGDIVFVRSTSLLSRLIRLFDKGRYSHVAIAISENEVIEANWNMKSKIVKFHYSDFDIVSINLTDNQRKHIPLIAVKYEGKIYDYIQVLSYIFNGHNNNPRHLICSELVYNILSEVDYLNDENLRDITPNELYAILSKKG